MTRRITSLDVARGLVMVLMAIDHVRVYSGVPAGGPTPGVFFTRWVTHFCAPAFVFLAGTGAFLHGRSLAARGAFEGPPFDEAQGRLARYLVTRGLMLVALELTVIRFSWTFNLDYKRFTLAGVIWMLGWCMVLLGGIVRLGLGARAIGFTGLAIVFLQQAFQFAGRALPASVGWLWEFVYPAGRDEAVPVITILYVLVPWIGVMTAGYGFGAIMTREPAARDKACVRIGLAATAAFLVLGSLAAYFTRGEEGAPPFIFRLLGQQKYPASQLYLLMTLGPTIAFLPLAERLTGWGGRVLSTFGRVPLFYYLLHIPTIHVAALVVRQIRDGALHQEHFATAPYAGVPPEYRWSLPLLYLVFAIVVAILYVPCRWFAGVKARHPQSWMRYL